MSSEASSIDLSAHNPLIGLDLPRLEKEMEDYQKWLDERTDEAYRIAEKARSQNKALQPHVEIPRASD